MARETSVLLASIEGMAPRSWLDVTARLDIPPVSLFNIRLDVPILLHKGESAYYQCARRLLGATIGASDSLAQRQALKGVFAIQQCFWGASGFILPLKSVNLVATCRPR
jgi:hypothetical protein